MKVKKAVIPAAGLGTRFLPATKAMPKEMLPIVDKPTLQYIIEECVEAGIEEVMLITRWGKTAIENHFDKSVELEMELEKKGDLKRLQIVRDISDMVEIQYIRQKEAKGLGHAIHCAHSFVGNDPFVVILGDMLAYNGDGPNCMAQLLESYEAYQAPIIGCQEVPIEESYRYGMVAGSRESDILMRIDSLVEKPKPEDAPSTLAALGRYVLTPDIMPILKDQKPGVGGEIQLTDALNTLAQQRPMYAQNMVGKQYDVGSQFGFLEASIEYALRRPDLKDDLTAYLKDLVAKL